MTNHEATHVHVGRGKCGHVIYVSVEENWDPSAMVSMWRDLAKVIKAGGTSERIELAAFRALGVEAWCTCPRKERRKRTP